MFEKKTEGLRTRVFESLGEFYQYAMYDKKHPEYTSDNNEYRPSSRDCGSWAGTETWDEAVSLALNGWTDGLNDLKYKINADSKFIKGASNRFRMRNDVTGSFVDIDKYIQGEPECMMEFETQIEPRFATVFVSAGASACVDKKEILERGRKVLEVIDALEQNNIRTRVVQIFAVENDENKEYTTIVCKDYQNRLDMESLNFAICNAAQLRRFAFAVWERAPRKWRDAMGFRQGLGGGYGRPAKSIKAAIDETMPTDEPHIVFDSGVADHYEHIDAQVEELISKGK